MEMGFVVGFVRLLLNEGLLRLRASEINAKTDVYMLFFSIP